MQADVTSPPVTPPRSANADRTKHDGVWIRAEYNVDRLRPRTKLWTCCGSTERLSVYCVSAEARAARQVQMEEEGQERKREAERAEQARLQREVLADRWAREAAAQAEVERQCRAGLLVVQTPLPKIAEGLSGVDRVENAHMVVANLYRFRELDFMVVSTLNMVVGLCRDPAGRSAMVRAGVLPAVVAVQETHASHGNIGLLCQTVIASIVSDASCRPTVIRNNRLRQNVLCTFNAFTDSCSTLEQVVNSLSHFAEDLGVAEEYIEGDTAQHVLGALARHGHQSPMLAETALRLLSHLTGAHGWRMKLIELGACEAALHALRGHTRRAGSEGVVEACVVLLRQLCVERIARARVLNCGDTAKDIVDAARGICGRPSLQKEMLELVKVFGSNKRFVEALEATEGAWQWLCGGTATGDSLVEFQRGHMHVPKTDHVNNVQMKPDDKAQSFRSEGDVAIVSNEGDMGYARWNTDTFAQFIWGQGRRYLRVSDQTKNGYFRLIRDLRMLPWRGESVDEWKERARQYEETRGVSLAMCALDHPERLKSKGETMEEEERRRRPVQCYNLDYAEMTRGFSYFSL